MDRFLWLSRCTKEVWTEETISLRDPSENNDDVPSETMDDGLVSMRR